LSLLSPGDQLMADKGCDVQDVFDTADVVNIPTFSRKTNQLSMTTVLRDRKIASKRVHVERVIGSAKTLKIHKNPMQACRKQNSRYIPLDKY